MRTNTRTPAADKADKAPTPWWQTLLIVAAVIFGTGTAAYFFWLIFIKPMTRIGKTPYHRSIITGGIYI